MIAALTANTNWDSEENDRSKRIEEIERNFSTAIEMVYHPDRFDRREVEIDEDSSWIKAARRSQERVLKEIKNRDQTVQEVIDEDSK